MNTPIETLRNHVTGAIERGEKAAIVGIAQIPEIAIYVACLASYNNGILHGRWIDATQDADGICEGIAAMLAASPMPNAEEHAVHDYSGMPSMGEWPDMCAVAAAGAFIAEHGDAGLAWLDNGLDADSDAFVEAFRGEYDSLEDYAEELIEDCGSLNSMPENLRCYFDYDAYARDLEVSGDVWTASAGGRSVFVFYNI